MTSVTSTKSTASSGSFEGPQGNAGPRAVLPKQAVEIVEGKKYLLVLDLSGASCQEIDLMRENSECISAALKERGIDATIIIRHDISVYELESRRD